MSVTTNNTKAGMTVIAKIGKSTEALSKKLDAVVAEATVGLNTVNKAIDAASEDYQTLLEKVAITEGNLVSLEEDYGKKVREAEYDLNMKSKENAEKVLAQLLKERGLESQKAGSAANAELQILELEDKVKAIKDETLLSVEKDVETRIKAAVDTKDLQHAAVTAESAANINSLKFQLDAALKQVKGLEAMITAEREARVEEARARANSQITVNAARA